MTTMKDGLFSRLGVAKVVHEEVEDYEVESYAGDRRAIQLQALAADKGAEILEPIIHDQDENDLPDVKVSRSSPAPTTACTSSRRTSSCTRTGLRSLDDATFLAHKNASPSAT
jgi:hypothetical protein